MPKLCVIFLFWMFLEKLNFMGDSENDLKINVFLAAVESAMDVDVRFKDPALEKILYLVHSKHI